MIEFLQNWFNKNIGKKFKYAYNALKDQFPKDSIKVSEHGCYKAFKRYSNFTYKRV